MCVCGGGGGGVACDNSTSFTSKDTAHRDMSNSIAKKWLTFYGSLNFRFPGWNGIARLSGITIIYFSAVLFSEYYYNTIAYDKE